LFYFLHKHILCTNFDENGLSYILGDFFTNSSGHPGLTTIVFIIVSAENGQNFSLKTRFSRLKIGKSIHEAITSIPVLFAAGQRRVNEVYKEALKRTQDEPPHVSGITGPIA
jgi:hypothetical protein